MSTAYDVYEQQVRERAHEIWLREGRPEGRADEHWALARVEIAAEQNVGTMLKPNPLVRPDPDAEPIEAVEGMADIPGRLNDQGERPAYPEPAKKRRRIERAGGA